MRLYLNYFKLRIITFLQYRTSAIAGMMTQFFFGVLWWYLFIWHFISSDTSVGINLTEIIAYTWLHQACYALLSVRQNDREISGAIRDGSVAYEIVRPYNLYFWWYIKAVSKRMANGILRIWPVLLLAFLLSWTI